MIEIGELIELKRQRFSWHRAFLLKMNIVIMLRQRREKIKSNYYTTQKNNKSRRICPSALIFILTQ